MRIRQYDRVVLKDGTKATVVEIFSEKDFLADVGNSPDDWDTIDISITDIAENIDTGEIFTDNVA
ncbi:MAG: hypothetical protein J6P05_02925 [Lachnospiraceae bacterium]|nr:hypothetical protein [Lachnospiraceae bacterium]